MNTTVVGEVSLKWQTSWTIDLMERRRKQKSLFVKRERNIAGNIAQTFQVTTYV